MLTDLICGRLKVNLVYFLMSVNIFCVLSIDSAIKRTSGDTAKLQSPALARLGRLMLEEKRRIERAQYIKQALEPDESCKRGIKVEKAV